VPGTVKRYLVTVFSQPTKPWRRAAFVLCLVATFAVSVPGAVAGWGRRDKPLDEWIRGPVRYIVTRSESKLFKRLETREERIAFVRRFWERRDPDPRTPRNEARIEFWQRVAEANRRFGLHSPHPGWRTDRGKMFILLGPPHDIETDEYYDTGQQNVAGRGAQRWIYRGLEKASNRTVTIVSFIRKGDGDWHLSEDPRLASPFFGLNDPRGEDPLALGSLARFERLLDQVPWAGGTLGTAMDLGQLQEVPTERELLRAVIEVEDFVGIYRGAATVHPVDPPGGPPVTAVTVAVRRAELDPPWDGTAAGLAQRFTGSAVLEPLEVEGTPAPIEIPEGAFVAEPIPPEDDGWIRLQALRHMPPGRWRLSAVLLDRQAGGAAMVERAIEVEEVSPAAPQVSGPLLAAGLAESGEAAPTGTLPFQLGGAVVSPRIGERIPASGRFALFIEIAPPAGVDRPVALDWEILHRENDAEGWEPFVPPGHLDDARGPRAWELPAERFEPGDYRAVFRARAGDGPVIERAVSFTIVPADP
jgi:GWxTD domain-containing protein